MRRFKQVLAVVLGTTMVFGSSLTAFAATNGSDASTAGEGQVLDFKVVRQVVPTALKVAINPNGYDVNLRYTAVATGAPFGATTKYYTKDSDGKYSIDTSVTATNIADKIAAGLYTATTSNEQIVTFNYGLANKSTVARKVTVKLDVEADSHVTFVNSEAAATAKTTGGTGTAERGEYKIYMTLVPTQVGETPTTNTYEKAAAYAANTKYYKRDASGVYSEVTTITDETTFAASTDQLYKATTTIGTEIQASELGDITMEKSTAPIAFAAKDGAGTAFADVAYSLPKSTWELKDDQFIDFDTQQEDLEEMFEMTAIGGLSGFTISGVMNTNAEWSLLETKTITITPTYAIADATGEEEAVDTGLNQVKAEARTPASAAPSIATTEYQYTAGQDVEVAVNLGVGAEAATGITSVTFTNDSGAVTTLPNTRWSFSDGKLVFNDSYTTGLNGKTRTHVVTFNDEAGTTVNVKLEPAE